MMRKTEMGTVGPQVNSKAYFFFIMVGQINQLPYLGKANQRTNKKNYP
jgi:hypothetical protein